MARLFYSELRLGLASVGGSNVGDFSRTRLNAGAEDVDVAVGDLHCVAGVDRLHDGLCSAWRANVGVDRFVLNEELMPRTRGYALFIFHGRTK